MSFFSLHNLGIINACILMFLFFRSTLITLMHHSPRCLGVPGKQELYSKYLPTERKI